MPAEGKVNTVHLKGGTRIMVHVVRHDNDTVICRESATKIKGAYVFNVVRVEPSTATGPYTRRRGYDIFGVLESGEAARIPHVSGNQTFWLAKA
jgi:hypothetical protein